MDRCITLLGGPQIITGIAMAALKTMTDELNVINKSLKGMKTIESATAVKDIPTNNSKEDLFKVMKELYTFSKKALTFIQPETKMAVSGPDANTIEAIVKKQLTDVLPELLKNALQTLPAIPTQHSDNVIDKVEKSLPTKHTLTIKRKAEEDSEEITESDWVTVVSKDVKRELKAVPVQRASVNNGTATLNFTSKAHLDKAQKALATKYSVSPSSEDRKKLDPKLTLSDINPDITTAEILREKLLEKNENIRELDEAGKLMKVVFFDKEERFAVIHVAPEIRESIKASDDKVYLGLEVHHVRDRIHVIQCYHCQEYGHMSGSRFCKKKDLAPTCFYCAGSHASKDCTYKSEKTTQKIKCSNCHKSRNYSEKNSASTHKASDNLCPFYVRERERIMSRTTGCEEAKNAYLQRVKELKRRLGRF